MCNKSLIWLVVVAHMLVLSSVTSKSAEVKQDIHEFIVFSAR